jgi:hypothetical protein
MNRSIFATPWKRSIALGGALALPVLLLTAWALLALPTAEAAPTAPGTCVDFEGLTFGDTYAVGQAFVDSGVVMTVETFERNGGQVTTDGQALVDALTRAGGSGLDVNTNNVNLDVDFGTPLTGLRFRFGEYGGNLNVRINGDFRNVDNFAQIDGLTIGNVDVEVVNGFGNDTGWVHLSGAIHQFSVGGQELWLDDLCPETNCVDFEALTPGTVYHVGDHFVDSGVPLTVEPFEWTGGQVTTQGHALVDSAILAGGWGLDLNANNVNIAFHFSQPSPHGLRFDFGEYGGNVNLEVNGDFRNVADFVDVHNATIGGTHVKVVERPGPAVGRVFLFGPVHDFSVGGQELWVDNVCPASGCVEFESLPAPGHYAVGDTFHDTGVDFTVGPFRWSDGTVFTDGMALVSHVQSAGGTGQDVNTNNVTLVPDFGGDVRAVSLLFGEYGGNVNLRINGHLRNVDNLAAVDGQTIAGVDVSVVNGLGNDKGRLTLEGTIHSLAIGGQELWIDHLCFAPLERIFLPLVVRNYP